MTEILFENPPTLGYMTMSYDREHLDNVIIDCIHQDYRDSKGRQRDDLKQLYITYQRERTWICPYCRVLSGPADKYCCQCGEAIDPFHTEGEFPSHMRFDSNVVPVTTQQINSEGDWPALWMWKLRDTLDAMAKAKTPPDILIVWDEDDRYYPDYTVRAVKKLLGTKGSAAVWAHEMVFVRHSGFTLENYNSAYGTIVGWRPFIDKAFRAFLQLHPDGLMVDYMEKRVPISKAERVRASPHRRRFKKFKTVRSVRRIGPLDGPFRRFLVQQVGKKNVVESKHRRYYFFTLGAATYVSGRHPDRKAQCIDK